MVKANQPTAVRNIDTLKNKRIYTNTRTHPPVDYEQDVHDTQIIFAFFSKSHTFFHTSDIAKSRVLLETYEAKSSNSVNSKRNKAEQMAVLPTLTAE